MIDRPLVRFAVVCLLSLGIRLPAQDHDARGVVTARVIRAATWNIRYGSAKDGPDHWDLRRERVFATISALGADVLGIQEAEASQVAEILDAVPRYAATGVHRDDGLTKGEACTILFDRSRFVLAESSTFWLSETPTVVASKSWDSSMTRICSTARLCDLRTGATVTVFNAHFDHRGQRAREASAELIRSRLLVALSQHPDDRVLLLGDLNAAEDNQAVRTLLMPANEAGAFALRDSFRVIHPEAPGGTFNGFDPGSDGGTRKIDHVFVGPGLEVLEAGIRREKMDGRHPSDHFPVWADLRTD